MKNLSCLKKLENKSSRETEKIIAAELDLPLLSQEKTKAQKDESIRVELTLSKEQMALLEEAKGLMAHAVPGATLAEAITFLAKRFIATKKGGAKQAAMITATAAVKVAKSTSPQSPAVPPKVKKFILNRDQCCQFKDPKTGRKCGSQYFLQQDHIHPRWAGGANEQSNLRILCAQHNKYRYQSGA